MAAVVDGDADQLVDQGGVARLIFGSLILSAFFGASFSAAINCWVMKSGRPAC